MCSCVELDLSPGFFLTDVTFALTVGFAVTLQFAVFAKTSCVGVFFRGTFKLANEFLSDRFMTWTLFGAASATFGFGGWAPHRHRRKSWENSVHYQANSMVHHGLSAMADHGDGQ